MSFDFLISVMLERASTIHADTNQQFDIYPYSFHLKRVLEVALKYLIDNPRFKSNKTLIAFGACYHDTIEDARLTYNDVKKEAGKFFDNEDEIIMATEIVYALTNEKGRTRAERANDKYYEGIRKTPFASFIKCCDRMANASYAIEHNTPMSPKYRQEMDEFISHVVDPDVGDSVFSVPIKLIQDLKNL